MKAILTGTQLPYSEYFNRSKKASRWFFTIVFFTLVSLTQAQEKYFSSKGEAAYFEKIEDIFDASSEKDKASDFLDAFEPFWHAATTPGQVKKIIMDISDVLYDKNARAFPDYHLFLTTIMAFAEEEQINNSFFTWHEAIAQKLQQPRYPLRHFNQLLKTTFGIVTEQLIFKTPGVEWYSRDPRYRFEYKNDTLSLSINSTTLVCHSRNDSIMVYDTAGKLDVTEGHWEGTKGRITWERSGFESNKVYALFDDYTINMRGSDFSVENTTFYNRFYFSAPLKGSIEHKVMSIRTPSSSNYPKFESYDQFFSINNIHPGMHYKGGFSQHGAKFRGSGTEKTPATISIYRNDTIFITAKSLIFSLREKEIQSRNTEVIMHLDTGQIRHPGLEFKYMSPTKDLYLIRSGEGISQSPFFDSYHNVSIDSEVIHWNLDNDYMELRMLEGAAQNRSFFESISFYRESFYNYLQGMDAIHPLQGLRNCYYHHDQQPFTAKDYARYLNLPENQVRQQIIQLSFHGFIDFNTNTDSVKIQDRLMDYIKFRMGKKDYDVIRFKSITPGREPNAIFDLKNYDLALNGVENISISDHQNVVFLPENEKVTLKYNRNFNFNGHILAGMVELFGDGFFFNYDDFRVDMQIIDSLRLNVASDKVDNYGRPLLRNIDNTIDKLSGHLQIDTADNKSGIKDFPHYPVLVSDQQSYVYYERPDIQNGAYNKEDFYFELNPFEIDSINQLSRKNIYFDGTLVSNIFPELDNQLSVRDDYSLGFVKQSPGEGYPIYDDNAHFTNEIDLSNKGLKGNGRLDYLTSTAESKEFTFLPDETHGTAHEFEVEPRTTGIEYPDVQGQNVEITYLPFEDQLLAKTIDTGFDLFKKETSLKGEFTLSPNGARAKGNLSMPNANLISDKMDLTHHGLMADSANFNLIAGENVDDVSFKTDNLNARLDFEKRQGRFTSREVGNKVEFTENRYIAYISEFSWDMDKNDISLGARGSAGNRFVSTHRGQDSLDFLAPMAVYDIETKTIEASEVYNIKVADADIILNDGIIKIHKDAEMEPLDSAKIIINSSEHSFQDAHVEIEGKFEYNGYGKYDFINGNKKIHTIDFHNIGVDDNNKTIAEGNIPDNKLFTFDRHFAYKGDVELRTENSLLTFDGGTQLLHPCSQNGPQDYVRFNSKIDPNNVRIPINDNTVNTDQEELSHDFFLQLDSTHVYGTFLEKSRRINNNPIVSANGFLRHNDKNNSFEIATEEKFASPDSAGSILKFHTDECMLTGEGNLDLGLDLEQVKLHSSGTITHHKTTTEVMVNSMFGADFMLDENSILTMANTIKASEAPDAKHDKEITEKRLLEWIPAETAKNLSEILSPTTDIDEIIPENIQHTLCFTDLELKWDTPSRSYYADEIAELGWIKNHSISKQVAIKALISRSRGGNSFEIHIEVDPETWFFYSYNNGKMLVLSSSDDFNEAIQRLDIDERKMKTGLGQDSYVFQLGSVNRLRSFMEFFEEPEEENQGEESDLNKETRDDASDLENETDSNVENANDNGTTEKKTIEK